MTTPPPELTRFRVVRKIARNITGDRVRPLPGQTRKQRIHEIVCLAYWSSTRYRLKETK